MTTFTQDLQALLTSVIEEQQLNVAPSLEHPTQADFGEYSTNLAMITFKAAKAEDKTQATNPRAWAGELVTMLQDKLEIFPTLKNYTSQITVAGPGFINVSLSDEYFSQVLAQAAESVTALLPDLGHQKTAIVEYSSPNIAKPFTIGHLRSTIIGDAVANLLEATGWTVKRDNHLGDWGTQFGKQIYAIKHLGEGSEEKNLAKIEASDNPVKDLVELYVEFHAKAENDPSLEEEGRVWFKKLEAGDPEARELWQKCISWSLKEFKRIYDRLGVKFTENPDNGNLGYGESFFEDKMGVALQQLEKIQIKNQPLIQESQGAKLIFYPDEKYPPLMIIKQDGATLYATRDLATDYWRLQQYGQDIKVINEVGIEQSLYFEQLFEAEHLAGWYERGQRVHVKHGHYRFKDKKMSTRKGNVIWLEEVLNEAEKRASSVTEGREIDQSSLQKIAIGALKWNDLKRSSHLDVTFDWDEILNLKGNSGPYLQYTYVRCHSILEKAKVAGIDSNASIAVPIDTQRYVLNGAEKNVSRWVERFSEAVTLAATEYAPHHVCTYLYNLAQAFNTFYTDNMVLGDGVEESQTQFRLMLTKAVAEVLTKGLEILGIERVQKM